MASGRFASFSMYGRISRGAASTAITVAAKSATAAPVSSFWAKPSPSSPSSFAARTSTGMTTLVSTPPSSSSKMMLGSVFAMLNELPTSPRPMVAASASVRRKPVRRLTSVATAIPLEALTSDESSRSSLGMRGAGTAGASCSSGGRGSRTVSSGESPTVHDASGADRSVPPCVARAAIRAVASSTRAGTRSVSVV